MRVRLFELLGDDDSFYKFKKRHLIRYWGQGYYARAFYDEDNPDTFDNMGPGEIICKLSNDGYNFTQDEFDKFITCAIYGGCNSWLVGGGIHCANDEDGNEEWANEEFDCRTAAMEIMFSKFKPNADQLDKMIRCHEYDPFTWIHVLNAKGYGISRLDKDNLREFGYSEREDVSDEDADSVASTK